MSEIEKNEIYSEIVKAIEKEAKKKPISQDKMNQLMQEALESTKFQEVVDAINVKTTGKRVIFVDGKGCLVYDEGVFYVEDSMDSKKGKRKLTKKQATELYVEYFFRYILNPAIEQKKLHEQVKTVAISTKSRNLVQKDVKHKEDIVKEEAKAEKKNKKIQEKKLEEKSEIIR